MFCSAISQLLSCRRLKNYNDFFNRIKLIEKIHYKSSQSKDYRLVLVPLAEVLLHYFTFLHCVQFTYL
jgi:hypothetical protein